MRGNKARQSGLIFLGMMFLIGSAPVMAQYRDSLGGNWNNPTSATITNIIMDRYARKRLEQRLASKGQKTAATSNRSAMAGKQSVTIDNSAVHFRSTGTQLKTREIADLIDAGNPQVLTLLTTILQEFDKEAGKLGKPNDLALALSFFFATNASVYHDAGVPPDPQVMELCETISAALVEGNGLKGVGDRQKQEMYEALVLYTGLALASYQEGKEGSNAESVKTGRLLAAMNLQAVTGISPDKINFTDQGLTIESEPAATVATTSQAAAAPSKPQDPASPAIHAGKLVLEFEGNEVRANQLYGGKRIRVNGRVNAIEILRDGRITLTFHSPAGGYAQTRCHFNKSQSSRLAQFNGGQEAIVEGTVRGLTGGLGGKGFVELENCTVP